MLKFPCFGGGDAIFAPTAIVAVVDVTRGGCNVHLAGADNPVRVAASAKEVYDKMAEVNQMLLVNGPL